MARVDGDSFLDPTRRSRIGNSLLILALVALFTALGALLVERRLTLISEAAFLTAGVLLLAFIIFEPARTRTWITSRQVRYGSNALAMTLALLVILGVANVLADRHSYRVDVTANRSLSLSEQTIDLLRTLEGPARFVVFSTSAAARNQAVDLLLDQYRRYYAGLEVEFHDPETEPSKAMEWGVTETWRPTVFILYQDRQEKIHSISEREITSALLRLTRQTKPVIYFLFGRGERDLEDAGEAGLSVLRERLVAEGFEVAPLNLLITETVPADASAVVAIGPRSPYGQDEVERLTAYADGGGAVMILLDPAYDSAAESAALTAWLAGRWQAAFRNDLVIDPVNFIYPLPTIPVVASYGSSPVAQGLQGMGTYFVEARSIAQLTADPDAAAPAPVFTPVVQTSRDSWGETSRDELSRIPNAWPAYDAEEDTPGPLTIAATLEDFTTGARLVLIGDSHFCANVAVQDLANGDLFINALHWLTEDEELISLRPQQDVDRYVIIRSNLVGNAIFAVLVILIPLLVLGIGGLVLLVRRMRR